MIKQKSRYIIVYYSMKPKHKGISKTKGWMQEESNIQWDETFGMSEGLKTRDEKNAQVILDIDDKKVVRNWRAGEANQDYETLFLYYYANYKKYIEDFITASERHREKQNS